MTMWLQFKLQLAGNREGGSSHASVRHEVQSIAVMGNAIANRLHSCTYHGTYGTQYWACVWRVVGVWRAWRLEYCTESY